MGLLKCQCFGCGQHLEYPAEGAGQTVNCPSCAQPLVLPSAEPAAPVIPPPLIECGWRADPATEKQKAKLRFFGSEFDEGFSKGQASDAIETCMKAFPERETAWQNRPATPEQLEILADNGEEVEDGLTYAEAKELIEECGLDELSQARNFMDYMETEDWQIDRTVDDLNSDWADDYREVTREEVAQAWALLKSRNVDRPSTIQLLDALQESFEDFKEKPRKKGVLTCYCLHCRCPIEIKVPPVAPGREITSADLIEITVTCPHCGQATSALTIRP